MNLEEQEEVVSLLNSVVTLTEEEGEGTIVRRVVRKYTWLSSNPQRQQEQLVQQVQKY